MRFGKQDHVDQGQSNIEPKKGRIEPGCIRMRFLSVHKFFRGSSQCFLRKKRVPVIASEAQEWHDRDNLKYPVTVVR